MATAQDAELVLKLYELRTETVMRRARQFVMFDFNPTTFDEIVAVQRDFGSENNGYWRQVFGYWEMASALVLRGALDPDLYIDSTGEPIHLYAKFTPFLADWVKAFGMPFMPGTAKLIERYPEMQDRYTRVLAAMEARRKQAGR